MSRRRRPFVDLLGWLASRVLRALGASWRVRFEGPNPLELGPGPHLGALWHRGALVTAYLFRDSVGQRSSAVATVLIDRILGVYGLLLLGTIASGAAWISDTLPGERVVLLIAPVLTAVATTGLVIFMKASVSSRPPPTVSLTRRESRLLPPLL